MLQDIHLGAGVYHLLCNELCGGESHAAIVIRAMDYQRLPQDRVKKELTADGLCVLWATELSGLTV